MKCAQDEGISHEGQIFIAEGFQEFTSKLTELIESKLNDEGKGVVSNEDVQKFLKDLEMDR